MVCTAVLVKEGLTSSCSQKITAEKLKNDHIPSSKKEEKKRKKKGKEKEGNSRNLKTEVIVATIGTCNCLHRLILTSSLNPGMLKAPVSENLDVSESSSVRQGVGKNSVLHASPTISTRCMPLSVYLSRSFSFTFFQPSLNKK